MWRAPARGARTISATIPTVPYPYPYGALANPGCGIWMWRAPARGARTISATIPPVPYPYAAAWVCQGAIVDVEGARERRPYHIRHHPSHTRMGAKRHSVYGTGASRGRPPPVTRINITSLLMCTLPLVIDCHNKCILAIVSSRYRLAESNRFFRQVLSSSRDHGALLNPVAFLLVALATAFFRGTLHRPRIRRSPLFPTAPPV